MSARRWRRAGTLDRRLSARRRRDRRRAGRLRRLHRHPRRPRRASRRCGPAGRRLYRRNRRSTSTPRAACRWRRARPSRPATRARIGRSCARCRTCSGKRLPYDSLGAAARKALYQAHPHLMRIGQIAPGDAGRSCSKLAALAATRTSAPFRSSVDDFYFTNPIARASAVMAECSALAECGARPRRRRSRRWNGRSSRDYIWPFIVIVAESLLLLVILLIAVAYVLYADRKIWAAVQMRRGPERGRPVGTAAIVRRPPEIRAQGADHSGRRQQGRVPARAARHLRAGARRLGGDPGQRRLGHRRHQCRHPLHLRHLLARRLRRDHGRLGVELEISVPRRRCARRRRWCPTKSRSASSSSPCCSASARSISRDIVEAQRWHGPSGLLSAC